MAREELLQFIAILAAAMYDASGQMAVADPAVPAFVQTENIATAVDDAARMTVPVMINGQGPFAFIVDTGADRTVLSRELADRLRLPRGKPALLHDTIGVSRVDIAQIETLRLGARDIPDVHAALLAQADLGAAGIIGIDSLQGRRVLIDFTANSMTVEPAEEEPSPDPGVIVVRARSRFGQLILVNAKAGDSPISVILDTGAEASIGNPPLRGLLVQRNLLGKAIPTTVVSVTGRTAPAELLSVPAVELAGVTIRNLPIAFAPLHSFKQFGLAKKPAMLLGMDVLRQFERVSIDFERKKVRLLLPRRRHLQ